MYVCNCRGIRERDARAIIKDTGEACALGVHARCGTTPKCGRCLVDIKRLIKETHATSPAMASA